MIEGSNNVSATEDFEFDALQKAQNYRAALVREFSSFLKGDILEVGAGIGQITTHLAALPSIRQLVSVEPESRFCRQFRTRHPERALIEGTVDALPNESDWDAILSINVLEHVGDDEVELVHYHRKLARRRGHLCLFVPARHEIYAPLDKDFGHHRRYDRKELRHKLRHAGFSIVRLNYFNWIGYFAWWFNFRVLRKRRFDVKSVVIFDRLIFPLLHAFERNVLRPPFGQSLLAVAQAGVTSQAG